MNKKDFAYDILKELILREKFITVSELKEVVEAIERLLGNKEDE